MKTILKHVAAHAVLFTALLWLNACASQATVPDKIYPRVEVSESTTAAEEEVEDVFQNIPPDERAWEDSVDDLGLSPVPKQPPQVQSAPVAVEQVRRTDSVAPADREALENDADEIAGPEARWLDGNEDSEELSDEGETIADSQHEAVRFFRAAEAMLKKKNPEAAMRLFHDFVQNYPDHVYAEVAELRIASCYFALGDFDLAVLLYDAWLKKYPRSLRLPEALIARAQAFESSGSTKRAKNAYREVLQQFPLEPESHVASRRLAELTLGEQNAQK